MLLEIIYYNYSSTVDLEHQEHFLCAVNQSWYSETCTEGFQNLKSHRDNAVQLHMLTSVKV